MAYVTVSVIIYKKGIQFIDRRKLCVFIRIFNVLFSQSSKLIFFWFIQIFK